MNWRTWVGLVALAAVVGCERWETAEVAAEPPAPTAAAPEPPAAPPVRDLHQPFDLAASPIAPVDSSPPPDRTAAGKSSVELLNAVKQAWDEIRFQSTEGKIDPVRLTLATDRGEVEMTLFPDLAPNHVRNLLVLAKVGYYDGLVFERVVKRQAITAAGEVFRLGLVTAGCPRGEGTAGRGHLGYFLKPEFNAVTHEEGTVGFWREDDDVSAGTRFYISLVPCPAMDGKYTVVGRVTRGMDVVHRIAEGRLQEPDLERPEAPTVIRKVLTD